MTALEQRINALFEELVPASGKADTVAGEIIRAVSRIAYRNSNDGDHVGVGYGNETCNPAARYLGEVAGSHVQQAVLDMWGIRDDGTYNLAVARLEEKVLAYLDEHPELKTTANSEDMLDYIDRFEDRDDSEDEEDEYYRQMDEEAEDDGEGFIYQMFLYGLDNHEYGYTRDTEDTLDALGYTAEEVLNDPRLKRGIEKAVTEICKREGS